MLAATPFLLCNAACAKAVAPPALPPVALKVSKVFANAISASSACIAAPAVETLKLAYGLLSLPVKSLAKLLRSLVFEYGFIMACLFFSKLFNSPFNLFFSAAAALAALLALPAPKSPPITLPTPLINAPATKGAIPICMPSGTANKKLYNIFKISSIII